MRRAVDVAAALGGLDVAFQSMAPRLSTLALNIKDLDAGDFND
jgi:hypothetical protein